MDIRSLPETGHPDIERAARFSRVAGFGSWAAGWVIFACACLSRNPLLFGLFAAWYLILAGLITLVASLPRRRQAALGNYWAARFHELAIRDDLTGLHNRRYFNSELDAQIAANRGTSGTLALALIDLNDFKSINDTFGHAAGDTALQIAGQAILDASPPGSTVARLGGDEFAVIMPGLGAAEADAIARRIVLKVQSASFGVEGTQARRGMLHATAGLATLAPDQGPGDLLQEADAALYANKRKASAA